MLGDRAGASTGANVEQRADMKERFDRVLGHDMNREMKVVKAGQV